MSNLTGVHLTARDSGVFHALVGLYFASAHTKRQAKKNEPLLEDIVTVCWNLLDTHLERRDTADLDRLLFCWKRCTGELTAFEESSPPQEYVSTRHYY